MEGRHASIRLAITKKREGRFYSAPLSCQRYQAKVLKAHSSDGQPGLLRSDRADRDLEWQAGIQWVVRVPVRQLHWNDQNTHSISL